MNKKFYHWEIALMVGILIGVLSISANDGSGWQVPETLSYAQYQISVFPFGVGHGTGEVMVPTVPEPEIEIRYYFPELWNRIRDAIGL